MEEGAVGKWGSSRERWCTAVGQERCKRVWGVAGCEEASWQHGKSWAGTCRWSCATKLSLVSCCRPVGAWHPSAHERRPPTGIACLSPCGRDPGPRSSGLMGFMLHLQAVKHTGKQLISHSLPLPLAHFSLPLVLSGPSRPRPLPFPSSPPLLPPLLFLTCLRSQLPKSLRPSLRLVPVTIREPPNRSPADSHVVVAHACSCCHNLALVLIREAEIRQHLPVPAI